jgi:DNA processing protein
MAAQATIYATVSTRTGIGLLAMAAPTPTVFDAADPRFPEALRAIRWPPRRLWVDGRLPHPGERLVAIVGSRAASRAGAARAAALAGDLVRRGWGVISGGALGIDAAAHRGALEAGGATFAVLGCGIDVVYPDRHARLFRDIAASGGLVSEHGPGVAPRPGQFPARNRLVAALAEVVIVAESRAGSGALITARLGAELGRPLLALPGSMGADGLLAAGRAAPSRSPADVDRALADGPAASGPREAAVPAELAPLLAALAGAPAPADLVARKLGRPVAEVLGELGQAELAGLVVRAPGGRFEVLRGH